MQRVHSAAATALQHGNPQDRPVVYGHRRQALLAPQYMELLLLLLLQQLLPHCCCCCCNYYYRRSSHNRRARHHWEALQTTRHLAFWNAQVLRHPGQPSAPLTAPRCRQP
jgi:hypothetical protein